MHPYIHSLDYPVIFSFFSTSVLAIIPPSNNFLLYSSPTIIIDLITNSTLIEVDLVVDTELNSLSDSSCRYVLLDLILVEQTFRFYSQTFHFL